VANSNPFAPKATNKSADFEQCPAGNYPGLLVALIDEGTHYASYQNQPERKVRKIFFVFEVEAPGKDGADRRFYIGADFSMGYDSAGGLVMGKKSNLRKLMEGWSGKPYADGEVPEFTKALGRPCLINVIHEPRGDRSYARLASVSRPVKGMAAITPTRSPFSYIADSKDPVPGASDDEKSEWLPRVYGERIHTIIGRSLEKGGTGRKGDSRPITENGESPTDFSFGANAPLDQQAEEAFRSVIDPAAMFPAGSLTSSVCQRRGGRHGSG